MSALDSAVLSVSQLMLGDDFKAMVDGA